MNTTIIAICAVCLIAAIILENKFKLPLGVTCLACSFVICFLAFKMSANKVITSFFPSTIVLPLILAMTYFSVFTSNGTSQILARKIIGLIKGNMKLFPWTLFALSTLMYTFLEGAALRYVIGPLVFSIAAAGGVSVLMAVSVAYLPFIAGSMNPFIGMDAVTRAGIFTDMGLENGTNVSLAVWIQALILVVILHLVIYIVTKSWAVPNYEFKGDEEKTEITAPQKKSLMVLAVTIVLFVVPPILKTVVPGPFTATLAQVISNYVVFVVGILGILMFGLDDWGNMLRKVSVKPIVMIIGVTFLIKTAQQAGLQDLCTQVATSVPQWLIAPVLLLISATLSFFVAAPTVQPMLFPMAAAMAATPAQAITYLACVALGLASSGISPISSSGAAFLSTVEPEKQEVYSKNMFTLAIVGPIIMALVTATGLIGVVSNLFAGWYY